MSTETTLPGTTAPAAQTGVQMGVWETRAVNLATLLRQAAESAPEGLAVVQDAREVTWAALDAAADAAAHRISAAGIRPGEAVLLAAPNSIEQIAAMFGIWRAGAVLAPVNFRSSAEEIAGMAETVRAAMVLCHTDLADVGHALSDRLGPGVQHLTLAPDAISERAPEPVADAQVSRSAPAWYFFTSGTTGRPKAAVITHHGLGFIITNGLADLMPGTTADSPSLILAPLSHGAATHLLRQVARAAPSIIATSRPMDPQEVWALAEKWSVESMFVVPTILNRLVEHPAVAQHSHAALRYMLYGGSPISPAEVERARAALGEVLVQYYGMAEVTGCITVLPAAAHAALPVDEAGIVTCGRVRTGMQVAIVDDAGRELPHGQAGRIAVAGPAVFAGYLDNPEANAEAFRHGWFLTGDLGHFDDRGCLYLTGRASDMYISGGSNVYPREIEEVLLADPDVLDAAVVGVPDERWGESGVAVCVLRPGSEVEAAALRERVRARLAGYKVPREVQLWEALPKTTNDKTDKNRIRARLLDGGAGAESGARNHATAGQSAAAGAGSPVGEHSEAVR